MITSNLRSAIQFIGLSTEHFKGHRFRIGAATHAASLCFSDQVVQKLGRWNYDAFKHYIRIQSFTIWSFSLNLTCSYSYSKQYRIFFAVPCRLIIIMSVQKFSAVPCRFIIIINSVQKFSAVPDKFIIIIKSVQKFSADTFPPIIFFSDVALLAATFMKTVQYDIDSILDNVFHMLYIFVRSPWYSVN